jgi:hypothetical protein
MRSPAASRAATEYIGAIYPIGERHQRKVQKEHLKGPKRANGIEAGKETSMV